MEESLDQLDTFAGTVMYDDVSSKDEQDDKQQKMNINYKYAYEIDEQ